MAVRVDAASEDPAGRELVGAAVVDGGDVMEEVGVEVVEVEPGAEGPLAAPLPGSPPELVVAMVPSTSLGRRLAGGFGEESLSEPGDWLVGVVRGVVLGVVMRLPGPPTFRLPGSKCEGRALRAFAASASRAVWNKKCNRICQNKDNNLSRIHSLWHGNTFLKNKKERKLIQFAKGQSLTSLRYLSRII